MMRQGICGQRKVQAACTAGGISITTAGGMICGGGGFSVGWIVVPWRVLSRRMRVDRISQGLRGARPLGLPEPAACMDDPSTRSHVHRTLYISQTRLEREGGRFGRIEESTLAVLRGIRGGSVVTLSCLPVPAVTPHSADQGQGT